MPAHPLQQPSTPESSGKPTETPRDAPPPAPDAEAAKLAREGTLFHLLVERGWEAGPAYTADQRIRTMTSEIAAASQEPVLAELRQIRESMAGFATKADLETLETNLRREMAERDVRLIKWVFGALLAQAALVVGLVTLLT